MADAAERVRALRSPLAVALTLFAAVMLAPGGLLVSWIAAGWWVLAAALAGLTGASAVVGAAINAALED